MMYFLLILGLIAADQGVKALVVSHMVPYSSLELWNFIHLTYVRNTGAAFGILEGGRVFFIVFTLLLLAAAVFLWRKKGMERYHLPASLILAGAVGNCVDRVCRGFVVDFIDFTYWPVFNIADIAVVCGTVLLALRILFDQRGGGTKERKEDANGDSSEEQSL
ncbi:MAG: signal peptidase II [Bacillota bacterium]|jgi:signal peptidase II